MNGSRKQNGEGSILQVSENKWVAKISLGTRPDGRVIVKQFSGKTEAIAKKKLRDFKKSEDYIEKRIPSEYTIEQYFTFWLREYQYNKLKPSSYDRLESTISFVFSKNIEAIVLQNVLQWLGSDYLDIRWNATRILISLLRNPENASLINHQIITLVDSENVYIKNLIMRNIHKNNDVLDATKAYVFSKCENDSNFVVRMV